MSFRFINHTTYVVHLRRYAHMYVRTKIGTYGMPPLALGRRIFFSSVTVRGLLADTRATKGAQQLRS